MQCTAVETQKADNTILPENIYCVTIMRQTLFWTLDVCKGTEQRALLSKCFYSGAVAEWETDIKK